MVDTGHVVVALSILFFCVAGYATLFSALLPLSGIPVLDALARDTHYKYFLILLVPTGAYFVIANWVGWQYYRNT
ncbi:hypothetical protein CYLTODRAFT_452116 [Cylindrobasidium torrendii FP15055 ss-10]|uniref:Uncharacterized protein n=1 Tax=Cylindrobasidium torrendii FP15055 ss-10 TaxID=1314674 RepID=A0A0D7BK44_9AGAR|nr:hypothetical protein CYLTODRAFT_452116 [Cylindrobasidium torrendii FP15055 ss-10]